MKKFCTFGGGSEANETMIKIALQHGAGKNATKFISWWEAYHGATMGALSATAQRSSKTSSYEPMSPQFIHVPLPNCGHCDFDKSYPGCGIQCSVFVRKLIEVEGPDNFAGMLFEPIVSAVGGVVPPVEYFKAIRDICTEMDILLMFDEVITGFGRTGKMLACQHYDVYPDMMSFGKGFISGYGIGAGVAVGDKALSRGCFRDHFHVFTNIGNLLSNAAAYANIRHIIDKDLCGNSEKMGKRLAGGLDRLKEKYPGIIDSIIGKGLLRSIVFKRNIKGREVDLITDAALRQGLIINANHRSRGNLIIIMPPLVITKEEIDTGMEIIGNSFREVFGK
jgi:4-aminobutyrate aminotransferase-like enzyme